jgi:DNA-binding SARP family transcriptional activator/tetratricopeptide (TPR) repeat protein
MVRIQVLGPLRLFVDEQPVSPGRPGARALLAWLVLHPGRHAREKVTAELDLNAPEMRLAVHELNKALEGSGLLYTSRSNPKELELVRTPGVLTIDYDRLLAAMDPEAGDEDRESAYADFAGRTLLEGLDNDSKFTDNWLGSARAQWAQALVELCTTSAYSLEQRGDVRGALRWSRAWAEIDASEAAVRSVMRLHAMAGEREQAIRAADAYLERTAPEQVSAEFHEAVEQLRRGKTEARRSRPVVAAIPVASEVELVGRTGVVEYIWKSALRARDARQIVFLTGEAGMGKTRVARALGERLVEQSASDGAALLYGRFDVKSREYGEYGGIAMALWGFLDHWKDPNVLRAQLGDDGPVLSRVLPGLRDRLPGLPAAPSISPGTDRHNLNAAVAALFARIALGGPTIVVLDDIHHADRSSLDLLRYVIDATTAPGLLLVCTLRPACPQHVAAAVAAIVSDQEASTRDFTLPALDVGETRRLAEQHLGGRNLAEADVERIYDESGGVPFHIEQAARVLDRAGAPLGEDLELEPETARLLAIAAQIGLEFSLDTLVRVSGLSLEEVTRRLEQVTGDAAILASDEPGRYGFRHALRHEAFLNSPLLDDAQRRGYSERAAQVEEAKRAHPARLARLWRQAGDTARAVTALTEAAAAAEQALAYEDAAMVLDDALRLVGGTQTARRCALLLRRGEVLWNGGHFRASRDAFEQAAAVASDSTQLAEAALGFSGRLGFQGVTSGTKMTDLQRRALEQLPRADTPLRARLLACLGQALTFAEPGARDEGAQLSREAEEMARRLAAEDDAHRDVLVDVLCRTCWATWTPENLPQRRELAEEIVETSRQIDRPVRLLESLVFRICGQVEAGEFSAARTDLAEAMSLARDLRQPYYAALVRFAEGMFEMLAGPADGEAAAREALDLGHRQEHPGVMQLFGVQIMYVYLQLNRTEELIPASRDLSACYPSFAAWRAGLALIYAECGMLAEAAEVAMKLLEDGIPKDMFWLVCADHMARVVAMLHASGTPQNRWLDELYAALLPYRERYVIVGGAVGVYWSVEHPLGLLAAAAGRAEDALDHFGRALRRASLIECRAAEAEARVETAGILLGGDYGATPLADAVRYLEQAIATADDACLARIAGRAEELAPVAAAYAEATGQQALAAQCRELQARAKRVAMRDLNPRHQAGRIASWAGPRLTRTAALFAQRIARMSDSELEAKFVKPFMQRAVFGAMANLYRADRGLGFAGEIGFELTLTTRPDTKLQWRITVDGADATAEPRKAVAPAVMIRMTVRDFVRFLTRSLNGVQAWVEGRLEVTGDPVLAARLVEMFGGESALVALG